MVNLKRASHELFRRTPDEIFPSLGVLAQHCQWQREQSQEIWQPPRSIVPPGWSTLERLMLSAGERRSVSSSTTGASRSSAAWRGSSKDTVNRLSPGHGRARVRRDAAAAATSRCSSTPRATSSARSTPPATRGCTTPTC